MNKEREFEMKHFLWLCVVCLPALLLMSCAYRHYDHRGIAIGQEMRGPDYHQGKVTWGSTLTKEDIDEVNRMRAELACQKP